MLGNTLRTVFSFIVCQESSSALVCVCVRAREHGSMRTFALVAVQGSSLGRA